MMINLIIIVFMASVNANSIKKRQNEPNPKNTLEDGPFGGTGGDYFTDGGEVHWGGFITAIEMYTEEYTEDESVTAIRVRYGMTWATTHGTPTGRSYLAEFNPGTKVIKVSGSAGDL